MGNLCLDKRVLGGLVGLGLGLLAVAPNLFLTALPFLLVAACPLSMLVMGTVVMGRTRRAAPDRGDAGDGRLDRREQVALVRAQLRRVGEQQAALADQLARLEAIGGTVEASTVLPARTPGANVAAPSSSLVGDFPR